MMAESNSIVPPADGAEDPPVIENVPRSRVRSPLREYIESLLVTVVIALGAWLVTKRAGRSWRP